MSKFILLLSILSFSSILCQITDQTIETAYDWLIEILKGMSDTEEHKCSNVFRDKRDKEILPMLKDIVKRMDRKEEFETIARRYGIPLIATKGLAENCNLLNAIPIYFRVNNEEGIKETGSIINKNAKEIYEQVQVMKSYETFPEKLVVFGKLLSFILDFYVH